MFPVFPVLFPVCSQIPANAFNVFPMFSISDTRAMSAVFCIPFSLPENPGNNGNSVEIERVARRARWNTRGTTGNRYVRSSDAEPWPGLQFRQSCKRNEAHWKRRGAGTTADSWLQPCEGEIEHVNDARQASAADAVDPGF